jgi:hypothetical protein
MKQETIIQSTKRIKTRLTSICQLQFDGCVVSDAPFVKNLGVHFDKALNMEKQVSVLVKSCFAQIRTIGRIRPYLSESACKTLVASGYISYRLWKRYSLWYQQQFAFETSNGPEHCGETYHPQKKVRPYYTRANGFTLASD